MGRIDGIKALTRLHGRDVIKAHSALIHALQDEDSNIKAAALFSLPIVALQRSYELFDYLQYSLMMKIYRYKKQRVYVWKNRHLFSPLRLKALWHLN